MNKLCTNCRWCRQFRGWRTFLPFSPNFSCHQCRHPSVYGSTADPVDGTLIDHQVYCSLARKEGRPCGPEGSLWEAKV